MRILLDDQTVHVWLPSGHATITAEQIALRTPYSPFTTYAEPQTSEDVVVSPALAESLVTNANVTIVDAVAIDGNRVAVVRHGTPATLAIVMGDGRVLETFSLEGQGTPLAAYGADMAFGPSLEPGPNDLADADAGWPEHRGAEVAAGAKRDLRLAANGDRLGIAAQTSGHVAVFSLRDKRFELVFRLRVSSSDTLFAVPIEGGVLVAVNWNHRWGELRTVTVNGDTVGAWPPASESHQSDESERGPSYGLAVPVVIGHHVVVCGTDDRKARVLELPSLRMVHEVELPSVPVDVHGSGIHFGCVSEEHVVLGRLVGDQLVIDRVLGDHELLEAAGAFVASGPQDPLTETARVWRVAERLESMRVGERLFLATAWDPQTAALGQLGMKMNLHGSRSERRFFTTSKDDPTAPLAPFAHSSNLAVKNLRDARDHRVLLGGMAGAEVIDVRTGTVVGVHPFQALRLLDRGVWGDVEERGATKPVGDDFDVFASATTVVRYDSFGGEVFELARHEAPMVLHTAEGNAIAWSTRDENGTTHVWHFIEPVRDSTAAATLVLSTAVEIEHLVLVHGVLHAVVRDAETWDLHVARIEDDELVRVTKTSLIDDERVAELVATPTHLVWATRYRRDRAPEIVAAALDDLENRTRIAEASFGALSSLHIEGTRLWWLESQNLDAVTNGVNVLEPRSVIVSLDLDRIGADASARASSSAALRSRIRDTG